jgi:hypothetical protein
MKLLLAFKSFLPRRLIVGIGSENWFAAGCQFGRRTAPLLAPQFRCTTHNSAANITSLQEVQLRQRNRISLRNTQIDSEYQIAAAEFRCATHKSAANINSLQQVQLWQRNRISLRNTQIGSEYKFAAAGSVAAAKQNFAVQHTNR